MPIQRKNKDFNPNKCGVTHFVNKIGGKWKVLVVYAISVGANRLSSLQRGIPIISKQMLVNQLRELEDDGIIDRKVFREVPPRVEYRLTKYGMSLMPIVKVVQQWGLNDMKRKA